MSYNLLIITLSLIWGSFLNMLGYRLLSGDSFLISRSFCPHCKHSLAWHDLLPLFSWLSLSGRCRYCTKPISYLYPLIEIITVLAFSGLVYLVPHNYWLGYALFFSALIIVIRTDLQEMLISRYCTLFLIPIAFILSALSFLPISLTSSLLGAITGYLLLWSISALFFALTKKHGMGEGDFELLACIGAFTGILGWWIALLLASLLGTLVGIIFALCKRQFYSLKIPFGPFLALGSIIYVLFQPWLFRLVFY